MVEKAEGFLIFYGEQMGFSQEEDVSEIVSSLVY